MTTSSGEPITVIWHIDDLMGMCMEDFELTKFLCYLAKIYGPKLSMHMGNKRDYLEVDLEFNDDGTLDMSMMNYLKSVIAELPEMFTGKADMPAANNLFTIRDKKEARALKVGVALIKQTTR
jgi:hypothetical protein